MPLTTPKIDRCRVCGNPSLIPCVSLGIQYLSSVFPENLDYRTKVPQWPLDLTLCEKNEASCGLLQLAHRLDLTAMYNAYPYTSSSNSSMRTLLKDVANSGLAFGHLNRGDVVLDIGGNDGTLLSLFQDKGFNLINIDPATNIQPVFHDSNYRHLRNYFGKEVFSSATDRKAKLIFSIAMFYHHPDPIRFSQEVAACLDDNGVWIIQMAYLPTMIKTTMYDNIVHEHNGYYATHQMCWIMERAGLEIFDVALNEVYGGSFRVFVKRKDCNQYPETDRCHHILKEELEGRIFDLSPYQTFMRRVEKLRMDLRKLCRTLKAQGKTIWAYGASTKGNTILQYSNLDKDVIVAAADANPFKIGKYMVGTDIPITDEATMRAAKPDYLLVLPYSFLESFMQREELLVTKGTKFIVPLPEVRIVP